jgi:hypothetical protein
VPTHLVNENSVSGAFPRANLGQGGEFVVEATISAKSGTKRKACNSESLDMPLGRTGCLMRLGVHYWEQYIATFPIRPRDKCGAGAKHGQGWLQQYRRRIMCTESRCVFLASPAKVQFYTMLGVDRDEARSRSRSMFLSVIT